MKCGGAQQSSEGRCGAGLNWAGRGRPPCVVGGGGAGHCSE